MKGDTTDGGALRRSATRLIAGIRPMPSTTVNAFELLVDPKRSISSLDTASLVVVTSAEPFIARETLRFLRDTLCPEEDDRVWACREFEGESLDDPRDVFDEAATAPMFGGATRSAVVRNADSFITRCRERLEQLADSPRSDGRSRTRGVVILEVRSLPSNTRLAKAVVRHGLLIDTALASRFDLPRWIVTWCKMRYGVSLERTAAELLLDRLSGDIGQVDQAIASLTASGKGPITADMIATGDGLGGGSGNAWEMVETAAEGGAAAAIEQLSVLLDAGESPVGLLAQAATVLRRLGTAAWLLRQAFADGRPASVPLALKEAGVPAWPKAVDRATAALRNLGPERARRLAGLLLETDRSLKAEASRGLRAQLAIERLFCMLARRGQAVPPAAPARPTRGSTHG